MRHSHSLTIVGGDTKPLEQTFLTWWLIRWVRGCTGSRICPAGNSLRYRGFNTNPCRLQRGGWLQGTLRPNPRGRTHGSRLVPWRWANGSNRSGYSTVVYSHGWTRTNRSFNGKGR